MESDDYHFKFKVVILGDKAVELFNLPTLHSNISFIAIIFVSFIANAFVNIWLNVLFLSLHEKGKGHAITS